MTTHTQHWRLNYRVGGRRSVSYGPDAAKSHHQRNLILQGSCFVKRLLHVPRNVTRSEASEIWLPIPVPNHLETGFSCIISFFISRRSYRNFQKKKGLYFFFYLRVVQMIANVLADEKSRTNYRWTRDKL